VEFAWIAEGPSSLDNTYYICRGNPQNAVGVDSLWWPPLFPYVPNTTVCLMETSSVPPSAAGTGCDDVLNPASVSPEAWSAYPQRKVNGLADNVDTTQLRG